jgi:hypothetical protein
MSVPGSTFEASCDACSVVTGGGKASRLLLPTRTFCREKQSHEAIRYLLDLSAGVQYFATTGPPNL